MARLFGVLGTGLSGRHHHSVETGRCYVRAYDPFGVLTLLKKLIKVTGEDRLPNWYDLLSDAAHPAFGARIAFATPPLMHPSKAIMVRSYARSSMTLSNGESVQALEPTVAFAVADSLIAAGTHMLNLLDDGLAIVDDFGLTTAAATLTRRGYWWAFHPNRGSRACPCGRGKWSTWGHRWGSQTASLHNA